MEQRIFYTLDEVDISTVRATLWSESRIQRGPGNMVEESRAVIVATKDFDITGLNIQSIQAWVNSQRVVEGPTATDFILNVGRVHEVKRGPRAPKESIRDK